MTALRSARTWARVGAMVGAMGLGAGASGQPILEVHRGSMTTYRVGPSPVQGVAPRADQRAVGIDGTEMRPSLLGWSIAADPAGEPWNGQRFLRGSVDVRTGGSVERVVDLALPADVPWVIGRSYNARQGSEGSPHQSDGLMGRNWHADWMPTLAYYDAPGSEVDDLLVLVVGADAYLEFRRVEAGSSTFRGVNGAAGAVTTSTTTGMDACVYLDGFGQRAYFADPRDTDIPAGQRGVLWKVELTPTDIAYVGDASSLATALSTGFDAGGRVLTAYDSEGRRFDHAYATIGGAARLVSITVRDSGGALTGDLVEYSYHEDLVSEPDEIHGVAGDLKLVTRTTPLSHVGDPLVRWAYYRYGPQAGPLAMVVDSEGARKRDLADNMVLDLSFLGDSNATLYPYASRVMGHDAQGRVSSVWFNGMRTGAAETDGEHLIAYETNAQGTWTEGYDQDWSTRATVTLPTRAALAERSRELRYFDETGLPISRVVTECDPLEPGARFWCTRVDRAAENVAEKTAGAIVRLWTPASIASYSPATHAFTAHANAGLVWIVDRRAGATDDLRGLRSAVRHAVGSGGLAAAVYDATVGYTALSQGHGGFTVKRAVANQWTSYPEASSAPTGGNTTSAVVAPHATHPLRVKEEIVALPVVSTLENGSGAADVERTLYTEHGRVWLELSPTGRLDAWEYDGNGEVSRFIRDARSALISPAPPVEYATGADRFHLATSVARDGQGRAVQITRTDGRVERLYYTRLADQRLVAVSTPRVDGGARSWGPMGLAVANAEGEIEAQGIIGVVSPARWTNSPADEWIDREATDPRLCIADASLTLATLTERVHDATGVRVMETRRYTKLEHPAEADTSYLAYDALERLVRLKDETGTIQRWERDRLGRVTFAWLGTGDQGWPTDPRPEFASPRPTAVDQMRWVHSWLYDGGQVGNWWLTHHAAYTHSGLDPPPTSESQPWPTPAPPGERRTRWERDAFGRPMWEQRPAAPHIFRWFDNLGQQTETGLYANHPGSLTTSPSSQSNHRLGLTTSSWDSRGQVWRSIRHKVSQLTGATTPGETITSRWWFTPDGLPAKFAGEEIIKRAFDSARRPTRISVLGGENDGGTYAGAMTVGPLEVVLRERHLIWDDDRDLLQIMARVERTPDVAGAPVLGPLYENNDANWRAWKPKYPGLGQTPSPAEDICKGRLTLHMIWRDEVDLTRATADLGADRGYHGVYYPDYDEAQPITPGTDPNGPRVWQYCAGIAGTIDCQTGPTGNVVSVTRDDSLRVIRQDTAPSPPTPTTECDARSRTIEIDYEKGQVSAQRAWPDGYGVGSPQETRIGYGVTSGDEWPPFPTGWDQLGLVPQNWWASRFSHPSSGSQTARDVTYVGRNALGQPVYIYDRSDNRTEIAYDLVGHPRSERTAPNVPGPHNAGYEGDPARLDYEYDDLGRLLWMRQFADAAGLIARGALEFAYDDWGLLETYRQFHDVGSAPGISTEIEYAWAKPTGREAVRRTQSRIPGLDISFDWNDGPGLGLPVNISDLLSRVTSMSIAPTGGTPLEIVQHGYHGTYRPDSMTLTIPGLDRDLSASPDPLDDPMLFPGGIWRGTEADPWLPAVNPFDEVLHDTWRRTPTGCDPGPCDTLPLFAQGITRARGDGFPLTIDEGYHSDPTTVPAGLPDGWDVEIRGNCFREPIWTGIGDLGPLDQDPLSPRRQVEEWPKIGAQNGLDDAGNWRNYRIDTSPQPPGTWDVEEQGNIFTPANELDLRTTVPPTPLPTGDLEYDENGNLTDDGSTWEYEYDRRNRLRRAYRRNPDGSRGPVFAEFTYNALGQRNSARYDRTPAGGDGQLADEAREWYTYDEGWRLVAVHRQAAGAPLSDARLVERYVWGAAGHGAAGSAGAAGAVTPLGGIGLHDQLVLRERDADGLPEEGDPVLEERTWYVQNHRGDVVVLARETGGGSIEIAEQVRYSLYGVPWLIPPGDADGNSELDVFDITTFGNRFSAGDHRADLDRDGQFTIEDFLIFQNAFASGHAVERGRLSRSDVGSRFGFAGMWWDEDLKVYHARRRVYDPARGRWLQRDPSGYADGVNLYEYCGSEPFNLIDPWGLRSMRAGPPWEGLRDWWGSVLDGVDELISPETDAMRDRYHSAGMGVDEVFAPESEWLRERYSACAQGPAELVDPTSLLGGFGSAIAGCIPFVGDGLEAATVVDGKQDTVTRAVAGASLSINLATGGLAPNLVPIMKGTTAIAGALGVTALIAKWLSDAAPLARRARVLDEAAEIAVDASKSAKPANGWPRPDVPSPKSHTSRNFRDNLEHYLGRELGKGEDAHHIVAKADERAQGARDKLKELGIDVNDPRYNGVAIPREVHYKLNNETYHKEVERALNGAKTKEDAERILNELRDALVGGD